MTIAPIRENQINISQVLSELISRLVYVPGPGGRRVDCNSYKSSQSCSLQSVYLHSSPAAGRQGACNCQGSSGIYYYDRLLWSLNESESGLNVYTLAAILDMAVLLTRVPQAATGAGH